MPVGPAHVSMNDFLIHRYRDVPRVAREGMRFRRAWPQTPGALGLWFASTLEGKRQISVSVWLDPDALAAFVRTTGHLRVMRDFRSAGDLITNAWTAERFDRAVIWRQAHDRLTGRVGGVSHH
jgi:hypothetical protein